MIEEDVLENTPETFQRLIDETNEWKDKYLRAVAEADNARKRIERDKHTAVKFANEKFAKDLLETLDNFENAFTVEMNNDIREGFTLIHKSLKMALTKNGIRECPMGTFDPNFHDAISVVNDGTVDRIVEVHRKGYLLDERLIRPAMVTISK
jgi:molecular chaperone GrpE